MHKFNPQVRRTLLKYNNKGLNIVSFSLDSSEDAWKKAIKSEGLVWTNVSDLKGGTRSPIAQKYGISGMPAIWLIAPDGKIISEGLRGEKSSKLCEKIFDK